LPRRRAFLADTRMALLNDFFWHAYQDQARRQCGRVGRPAPPLATCRGSTLGPMCSTSKGCPLCRSKKHTRDCGRVRKKPSCSLSHSKRQ
jgi:hypothetical protein